VVVRRSPGRAGQPGAWRADLNTAVLPRLRLQQGYADWCVRHRAEAGPGLGQQLQEARWTLRNVEQRFATILAVARAILQRQHRFLALGPLALRPLALREIAQAVGVHESTVSRVTQQKYMATPCGLFELRFFFSRGLATDSGGHCSPTAVRGLIRALVAAEPHEAPLSDVDLARALMAQGLQVARRTVTKYRQQLRIEPAPRRGPSIR
jgi:RNA polymerase sigma-54 factor